MIICVSFNNVYAQGKTMPYDYYPDEYKSLNAEDWQKMKLILDRFLAYETIEQIRELEKPNEARFILTRMASIDWESQQKEEIVAYLNNFIETLLQGRSFIPDISRINLTRDIPKYDPVYLPKRAIWAMFFIDNNSGCKFIEELWRTLLTTESNDYINNLRYFTLWTLEKKYDSKQVDICLQEIEKIPAKKLNSAELKKIEETTIKYNLSQIKKQSDAWDFLWDQSETKTSEDVLTHRNHHIWYDNISFMKEVFKEPDISILLDMSQNTTTASKKYILLFNACFLINTALSTSPDVDSYGMAERAKKLTDDFYEENMTELIIEQATYDFLKDAIESMNGLMNK